MASIKISELEEVTELSTSDVLPIINENKTKKVSLEKLNEILGGSGGEVDLGIEILDIPGGLKSDSSGGNPNSYHTDAATCELLSNYINSCKDKQLQSIIVKYGPELQFAGVFSPLFGASTVNTSVTLYKLNTSMKDARYADIATQTGTVAYFCDEITLYIKGTWTNGVYSCTGYCVHNTIRNMITQSYVDEKTLLKTNTTEFTPTGDYNPATKKYVDDQVATKQPLLTAGANITIDGNNVISAVGGGASGGGGTNNNEIYDIVTTNSLTANSTTLSDTLDQFTNVMSKYIAGEITTPTFRLKTDTYKSNTPEILFRLNQVSGSTYKYDASPIKEFSSSGFHLYRHVLSLTVNTSTGAVTYAQITNKHYQLLAGDMNQSYTPTQDYNPATKKYVDDAIANIEVPEGGGNADLSNVLTKDNTEEFTPDGDYEPATKKYVDDSNLGLVILNRLQLGSSVGNGYGVTDEVTLNKILDGIVKGGNYPPAILANNGSKSILFTLNSTSTSNNYKSFTYRGLHILNEKTNTYEIHTLTFRINGMGYVSNDTKTISNVSTSFSHINRSLNTDNIISYTPTGDYNPATKKYVDDAISAAIATVLEAEY